MFLIYSPAGEPRREWVFKPNDVLNREAEQIEKVLGCTWQEFLERLQKGQTMARRALLWTMMRRDHSVLRFPDVEFRQGELDLEFDKDELQELRKATETAPEAAFEGKDRDAVLEVLDRQIEQARENPDPKAPANSNDSTTSTPSPKPDADQLSLDS